MTSYCEFMSCHLKYICEHWHHDEYTVTFCRSTQERKIHDIDKKLNPDNHNPQKKSYSYDRFMSLCYWCSPDIGDRYEYNPKSKKFEKKKNVS